MSFVKPPAGVSEPGKNGCENSNMLVFMCDNISKIWVDLVPVNLIAFCC